MLGDHNRAQNGLEGYYIKVILLENELRCIIIVVLIKTQIKIVITIQLVIIVADNLSSIVAKTAKLKTLPTKFIGH